MHKKYLETLIERNSYLNILKDSVKSSKRVKEEKRPLTLISELLSMMPSELAKIKGPEKEMEILRLGIIAEYDAINLYEQMAQSSSNLEVKKVLLDIANEEKQHIGEFESLLKKFDSDHQKMKDEGESELENII